MALPVGSVDQCGQPVPPGFLHHHVQRSRVVSLIALHPTGSSPKIRAVERMIIANSCLSFFPRSDYINPIDLCNRLNAYIIPEAAVHAFLTFLFVINGYWLAIVLNLPLLAFNAKK